MDPLSAPEPRGRLERLFARIAVAQLIMTGLAVLISVAALYAALTEADASRKQTMASVWPRVIVYTAVQGLGPDAGSNPRFSFSVQNAGIGPARIQRVEVRVDDVPVATWDEALARLLGAPAPMLTSGLSGRVLPADTAYAIVVLTDRDVIERVNTERDRLRIALCYCSVFDQCWETQYPQRTEPVAVRTCARTPGEFQQ